MTDTNVTNGCVWFEQKRMLQLMVYSLLHQSSLALIILVNTSTYMFTLFFLCPILWLGNASMSTCFSSLIRFQDGPHQHTKRKATNSDGIDGLGPMIGLQFQAPMKAATAGGVIGGPPVVDDDKKGRGRTVTNKPRSRAQRRQYFLWASPNVPAAPEAATYYANPDTHKKPIVERLKAKFAVRPIWSRAALIKALGDADLQLMDRYTTRIGIFNLGFVQYGLSHLYMYRHLPCVAYRFSGGPWRNMWIVYAHDPRSTPPSRMYDASHKLSVLALHFKLPTHIMVMALV
jgi:hypothetical protein